MEVTIKHEFDSQELADILCSGIEGGINYWGVVNLENAPMKDGLIDYKAIVEGTGFLTVIDIEDPDEYKGVVNAKSIKKAIQIINKKYNHHMGNIINADYHDAETGDVLVQCAAFGEIVFG